MLSALGGWRDAMFELTLRGEVCCNSDRVSRRQAGAPGMERVRAIDERRL